MTSDYYFRKWKKTLKTLKNLVELDTMYQISKAHDQQICEAAQRLNGVLGNYIVSYNEALECLQHNLQIQKTEYIYNIVKTIEARILELKGQLRKLEGSYCQFLTNGLIEHKITPHDIEFSNISLKYERPENIKMLIDEALLKAKEIKKKDNTGDKENVKSEVEFLQNFNWWEDQSEVKDEQPKGMNITAIYEVKEVRSEETLKRKEFISLIQAHELTRQATRRKLYQAQKREMWEKELKGTLNPAAPLPLREKSAQLIQRVVRHYFVIKRKRIRNCQLDEKLNLNTCSSPAIGNIQKDNEQKSKYSELYKKYEIQWKEDCHKYKQFYLKRKRDDIFEDYSSYVRDWLRLWYEEARFFYDIPKENRDGIVSIIKEEVPSPSEWLDKYEAYLEMKKANKNKTSYQLKLEQQEAKEKEAKLKREELQKKKLEAELLKNIMKNPTLHPGYNYPMSNKTHNIVEALEQYFKSWNDLDKEEILAVKEKYVKIVDEERLCMEANIEICKSVSDDMRKEIKTLKKALKYEYLRNGEQMPEQMKEKTKKTKRPRKLKIKQTDNNIFDKFTDLAVKGHLKEYPLTNFEDFLGDFNYAGADLRCALQQTLHYGGESRALWWERCRDVIHGFKRVLLVGPNQSGKTTLVHAMATVNDAVLYELNPAQIEIENLNVEYLQKLVNSITTCAKMTQPSIIYIKYVHKLYWTKVPREEAYRNFDLIKRFFIRKLFKKINKHDRITIVGSCVDPWMTKSKQMVTKFSNVLLLPETNYSATYLILRKWVLNNRIVPRDLNIEALAYVLQGYSFGYLKKTLDDFLTADQIVKIAAYCLKIEDIYNYIIEDDGEDKIDYNKYVKWYTEKTHWGKLEKKRLEEKIEFKLLVQKWQEKMEKKKKQDMRS